MARHAPRPTDTGRRRKKAARPIIGTCHETGKLSFASRAKARKELRLYVADLHPRAVYECHFCGHWHLTSQRRKEAA